MLVNVLKAFLIGICASVPLGPVAIYVLQVSLSKGHKPGFLTGLGATTIDTLYAVVAVFALAFAERFIETHKVLIFILGGLIVALVGASIVFKDPFRKLKQDDNPSYSIKDYVQALALGLSNPAAIFVMLTLFAFFGVRIEAQDFRIAPIILAVSAGSASYWFLFSWCLGKLRRSFRLSTLVWINRVAGIVVLIVGIALMAEGFMKHFML